jgi:hypothetical protein
VPIRFLQVPARLMQEPKAGEALREDFLIPGLLGELQRCLGILFDKKHLLLSEHHKVGKSLMAQSFPLFLVIA